jgi:hypothetical protein
MHEDLLRNPFALDSGALYTLVSFSEHFPETLAGCAGKLLR